MGFEVDFQEHNSKISSQADLHQKEKEIEEQAASGMALHQVFNKDTIEISRNADPLTQSIQSDFKNAPVQMNAPWWNEQSLLSSLDSSYIDRLSSNPVLEEEEITEEITPQVYKNPPENASPIEIFTQAVQTEPKNSWLMKKIFPWWYETPVNMQSPLQSPNHVDLIASSDLDAAKTMDETKKTHSSKVYTPTDFEILLSLMNTRSIEQVVYILNINQLKLEEENAHTAEKTFLKYEDFKKLQEKVFEEIKEVLLKDQKWASRFRRAQDFALATMLLAGILAATASTSWLAFLPATLVSGITSLGPAATAGFSGITQAMRAFFDRRVNEDKAKQTDVDYKSNYYNERIEETRDILSEISTNDNAFKEIVASLLKRYFKMLQLVAQQT